ncbi:hypothetical protein [Caldicellulosiruptor naganoensis]|uniref:ABC transporter permease n=1 Tax=Caldicellulosiruptor naganoensis TaxID=29324 RepID=A0ABY7BIE8_9FIRM|nr:hypothetical protein [Caldicellulosiruptor naganoensis]WAM31485.1 hypothetical protein OTJ99_002368 [Caldicellulosiruptor naganoensis]
MLVYFKLFKKNKIIPGIVFLIFLLFIALLINKTGKIDTFIFFATIYSMFVLVMLLTIKSSFFAQNTKLREMYGSISYSSLLFLLPIRRNKIVTLELISDVILILIYILFLNTGMLILKVFNYSYSYNFNLFFVGIFSFVLIWYSIYTILYSLLYFIKNSAFQTIYNTIINIAVILFAYIPFWFGLRLSEIHKREEKFITNLYTNHKSALIVLFVSIILFLISFIVNKAAIYRREI